MLTWCPMIPKSFDVRFLQTRTFLSLAIAQLSKPGNWHWRRNPHSPHQQSHSSSSNCPDTVFIATGSTSEPHSTWLCHVPSVFSTLEQTLSLSLCFGSWTLRRLRASYLVECPSAWLCVIFPPDQLQDVRLSRGHSRSNALPSPLLQVHNICFWFIEFLAMKTSVTWGVSARQLFPSLPLVIIKYLVGRTLTLCKYPIPHQLAIYCGSVCSWKNSWIPVLFNRL